VKTFLHPYFLSNLSHFGQNSVLWATTFWSPLLDAQDAQSVYTRGEYLFRLSLDGVRTLR
jgi:hypothetical protein